MNENKVTSSESDPGLPILEDAVDKYCNRILAGRLVRCVMHTSVTPNQITVISLLLGIIAISMIGFSNYFICLAGTLLLQVSIVIDCMDGQLARVKKLTSEWGDVYDHTSDDAKTVFLALVIALKATESWGGPIVVMIGLVSVLVMVASQFFYCGEYHGVRRGRGAGEMQRHSEMIHRMYSALYWRRGDILRKILLYYYLIRVSAVMGFIWHTNPYRKAPLPFRNEQDHELYYKLNRLPLLSWQFMGLSVFSLILVCFAAMGIVQKLPLACCVLIPFYLIVLSMQIRADKKYLAQVRPSSAQG